MTGFALALLVISALTHATWNLLAKRTNSGAAFVWLFNTLATVIYTLPAIAVLVVQRPQLGMIQLLWMLGSAILQLAYFLVLQRGYRTGDLSLVYPLARGTGPLLSTTAAIALLGERPTLIALTGAVCIGLGVFILTGDPRQIRSLSGRWAVVYGLITGGLIAAYTLWDKYAVSTLMIPPVVLYYGDLLGQVGLLTPLALRDWQTVASLWRTYRLEAFGIAFLSPLSYVLVLTALVFTRVSYVAPTREISILIGVAMGNRLLAAEGDAKRRLLAAGVMLLGVVALAVG